MKFDMVPLGWLLSLMVIFIIFLPETAEAQWSLTPRVYVEYQYDDNIFLSETDEQDDFITTVSPGVTLNYRAPTGEINFDYEFRRSFYYDFSELDFSDHRVQAEARNDFGLWFGVGITETFIRSEDPIELTGLTEFERPSIRTGTRNRYTRNIVEPEATIRFAENRSIRLGYRNQVLRNEAEDIADLDENAGNALLTFHFNINNGIEVFYEHINLDYGETVPPTADADEDLDGDEIRGRYTYYFKPRTSVFLEYRYYQRDIKRETATSFDYEVHNPRLGFTGDLYENVNLSASAGYAIRNAEDREDEDAYYGRVDISVIYKLLTLSLYGETGLGEDYLSAESFGSNEFWRAGVNARYQLFERFWAGGFFYIQDERYVDLDRRDRLWSARGNLNYQPLRWLFLSFDYEHNERDSDVSLESYDDNRYFGRITVQYNITEFF